MSDLISIKIAAYLDKDIKAKLQAELNQMSKQAAESVSRTRKTTSSIDNRDSETKIKLWKAQESAIGRVRKAQEEQEKWAKRGQAESAKEAKSVIDAEKKRANAIAYVNAELRKRESQEKKLRQTEESALAKRQAKERSYDAWWNSASAKREERIERQKDFEDNFADKALITAEKRKDFEDAFADKALSNAEKLEDKKDSFADKALETARQRSEARIKFEDDFADKALNSAEKLEDKKDAFADKALEVAKKRTDARIKFEDDFADKALETVKKRADAQIEAEDRIADQAKKYAINQQQLMSGQKGSLSNRLEGMVIGKESLLKKYPELSDTYKKLKADVDNFGKAGTKSYKDLSNEFGKFNNSLKQSALHMKNTNKDGYNLIQMAGIAAKKFVIWQLVVGGVMKAFRSLQEAVKYVIELDGALNDIRIVTGQTQEEVENLARSYGVLSVQMSASTSEIAKQAAELYRQGLAAKEVEERLRGIVVYAKISGLSLAESNKIITATMNATGESAQKIINIFSQLGDTTAAGADEIGEALQKVASTADNMGVSLEQGAAMLATVSSVTRESAQNIGNSLKSILSRYASIKSTGFNDEDATKLNDVTEALTSVGIQAVDSQGQLRNFMDVLQDLGRIFPSLTKNQQAYIATTMAGTYQRNRFTVLLQNFTDYTKNYEQALNSAGAAQQKFSIYQESANAKIDKFTATWQNLGKMIFDSGVLKMIIDFGTYLGVIFLQADNAMKSFYDSFMKFNMDIGGDLALFFGFGEVKYPEAETKDFTDALDNMNKALADTRDINKEGVLEASARVNNARKSEIEVIQEQIKELEALREESDRAGGNRRRNEVPKYDAKLAQLRQQLADANYNLSIAETELADKLVMGSRVKSEDVSAIQEEIVTAEKWDETLKKVTDSVEENSDAISESMDGLGDLADLWDSVSDNETIAADRIVSLIAKYPELASQIVKINDLTTDRKSLVQAMYNLEKQSEINLLKAKQKKFTEEVKQIINLAKLKAAAGLLTMGEMKEVQSAFNEAMSNVKSLQIAINAIDSIKITDKSFRVSSSSKGKTAEEIRKENIAAVTEAQSTITEVIKTEVEKRKDAIESQYEDEIKAIDEVIEANKKRWAEEDFNKSVTEQQDAIKKLNAEKSKYMAAALSGDLVAMAKVKEIDEEIAENKKKLDETQTDRSRDLQTEALETMKSVAEEQKNAQLESLNTIYDETQVTSNAIQALFATNLAGFETLLSSYLSKLGLAEGEIKRVVGSVAGSFSSAQAGVGIAKGSGVSAGEFGSFAEGGKSPMQVAMEASGKYSAAVIKADLAKLLALQASWATATDKAAVNRKANEIRAKYGISDPQGYRYQAWSYVGSFASGGVNDSSGWARLHGTAARPEYILNYDQAKEAVMGNYSNTPLRNLANTTNNNGGNVTFGSLINIEGNVDKAVIPDVERIANTVFDRMKTTMNKYGQVRFAH